jgi:hypothetical protein
MVNEYLQYPGCGVEAPALDGTYWDGVSDKVFHKRKNKHAATKVCGAMHKAEYILCSRCSAKYGFEW